MKILDTNDERTIIRLNDGTIVTVKEEEVILRYKDGNRTKTKKFGYSDMIEMNNLICKIMQNVIDERNKLKQCQPLILTASDVEIVVEPPFSPEQFEEKTRK